MTAIRRNVFLSLATVATLGCGAAWADPSTATCASVSGVQRRIVEHANQDMQSLQSYVQTTTYVHGVDMNDVKQGLDSWRAAVKCQDEVAAAKAATNTAQAESSDALLAAGR